MFSKNFARKASADPWRPGSGNASYALRHNWHYLLEGEGVRVVTLHVDVGRT